MAQSRPRSGETVPLATLIALTGMTKGRHRAQMRTTPLVTVPMLLLASPSLPAIPVATLPMPPLA